jgi:hypothetical protein
VNERATKKRRNMKSLFCAAALFAALLPVHCFGESFIGQAKIPFNFQVGKALFAAGEYRINESGGLLVVRDTKGKALATFLTMPTLRSQESHNSELEFRHYGNEYFLANLWLGSSREGAALYPGKREKEMAQMMKQR